MRHICKHCGTRYRREAEVEGFCCAGCAHVYQLIQDEGLDDFYGRQAVGFRPVGDRPFQSTDFAWAAGLQRGAESSEGDCRVVLRLNGMSCVGCVWLVEHLCRRRAGVTEAKASLTRHMLRVQWVPGAFDLVGLIRQLHTFGYDALEAKPGVRQLSVMDWRVLLSGIFAVNSGLLAIPVGMDGELAELSGLFHLLQLLCLLLSALSGGAFFLIPLYRGLQLGRYSGEVIRGLVFAVFTLWSLWQWLVGMEVSGAWLYPVAVVLWLLPDWLAGRLQVEAMFIRGHAVLGLLMAALLAGTRLGMVSDAVLLGGYLLAGLLWLGLCCCFKSQD